MSKHKNFLPNVLKEGRSYTWTEPDGGDLASMRAIVKHGQTLTLSPVVDPHELRVGDIVFVEWHQGHMLHMIKDIQGDRFLIANSLGGINGWVPGSHILGRVSQIIDPEPRPSVPNMLEQLEAIYHKLVTQLSFPEKESERLLSIIDDLRWYTDKIGMERWDKMPRQNKWSFEQNLWHLAKQARGMSVLTSANTIYSLIHQGKECTGLAAEILALLDDGESWQDSRSRIQVLPVDKDES
ncbi:hypothetical protein TFLX_01841 [Thermoflexales bacterium]|nr:hypothetical protein TFLX_01841 [Thermoflexales bacterium]